MDLNRQLRNWQEEARRTREADAPLRAQRLDPAIVSHWTRQVENAAPLVTSGARPCDYGPWTKALAAARGATAPTGLDTDSYAHWSHTTEFRAFMEDIALPAWPEPRRDLIEFALTFLEADVMLFRSGYAKRHLINRLRQSPLTETDIARIGEMLHRAAQEGTGLEEYRAWCRLAAQLVGRGHLDELPEWLEMRAEGAVLTLGMADGGLWRQFHASGLTDDDIARLGKGGWLRPHANGVAWPEMGVVVPAGETVNTDDQRIRRNAWRMLDHLTHRTPQGPDEAPRSR